MAIASALQIKGLFVYASKGFTLWCRIKILRQPFSYSVFVFAMSPALQNENCKM